MGLRVYGLGFRVWGFAVEAVDLKTHLQWDLWPNGMTRKIADRKRDGSGFRVYMGLRNLGFRQETEPGSIRHVIL